MSAADPAPVETDPFTTPWSISVFAAAILTNGPIKVKRAALEAVRRHDMWLRVYQEWDEETQTMTYTVPEITPLTRRNA